MKKIFIIFLIAALTLAVLGISKNQLIKSSVILAASKVLGVKVQMASFSLGIAKPAIRIRGLKLYNPQGFPKEPMVDIPQVNIEYDLGALLKKRLRLNRVVFDLNEMAVVKNKGGAFNVDELKVVKKEEKPPDPIALQIDYLSLSIGRVVYKDFSRGEKPSIEIFEVNIKNKIFKNIGSAQQLASLILLEALKPAAIKGAKVYALSGLAGVSLFSPVGAVLLFTGKDSARASFDESYDKVYKITLEIMKEGGKVQLEDISAGDIRGEVNKVNLTVKIVKKDAKTVQVSVAARKYLLPKPQVASSVIYQIAEKLK